MSWILGAVPKNKYGYIELKQPIGDNLIFNHKSQKIRLFAGGTAKNLYSFVNTKTGNEGSLISGIGLRNNGKSTKINSHSDWEKILNSSSKEDKICELDGHFIIIEWDENYVTFYSDVLGLRDIYIVENENGIYFSTNIKWLAEFIDLKINFFEFGSRWLLYNQISDASIFKGVKRITAGKKATISLNDNYTLTYKDYNWLPEINKSKFGIPEFSSQLKSLVNVNVPSKSHLSLSLSGGMDSRVILSCLLKSENLHFDTHTFGNDELPDSIIAQEIVKKFSLQHDQFEAEIPAADIVVQQIRDYTTQTLVNNSASAFLQLQNYFYLKNRNGIVIDGGFGEIWRSEFFYKLFLRGKGALLSHDIQNIIPYLKVQRADVFSSDVNEKMNSGVKIQLENLFEMLPEIETIGIRNWLDIFAIKTRLTNYYSPEQTWLDGNITSFMPFVQQSILKNILNMPLQLRQNSKLFRSLITHNAYSLKKFGLAKGQFVHPYCLNSFQSRLWSLVQSKFIQTGEKNYSTHIFLNSVKEFVFDTLTSQVVKECSIYDYRKIKNIIDSYYSGNLNYKNELDWWLSFELLRQST